MKILNIFFRGIISIVLFVIGTFIVFDTFELSPKMILFIINDRALKLALGCILMIIVLIYWFTVVALRQKQLFISFENEYGNISISVDAISNFIRSLSKDFNEILDMKSDIYVTTDGKIVVNVWLEILAGCKLQSLSSSLQERIKNVLKDSLGITDIEKISITVKEIVSRNGKRGEASNMVNNLVITPPWQ